MQAEDRCHRLGQTRPVTVYRFVTAESVDEKIVAIAARKLSLDRAVLSEDDGGGKMGDREESRSMAEILKALLEEAPPTGGGAVPIPDVLE